LTLTWAVAGTSPAKLLAAAAINIRDLRPRINLPQVSRHSRMAINDTRAPRGLFASERMGYEAPEGPRGLCTLKISPLEVGAHYVQLHAPKLCRKCKRRTRPNPHVCVGIRRHNTHGPAFGAPGSFERQKLTWDVSAFYFLAVDRRIRSTHVGVRRGRFESGSCTRRIAECVPDNPGRG